MNNVFQEISKIKMDIIYLGKLIKTKQNITTTLNPFSFKADTNSISEFL